MLMGKAWEKETNPQISSPQQQSDYEGGAVAEKAICQSA
jgi:hypothetical protein